MFRYPLKDAWYCYYSDLVGKATKDLADKMRLEYLLSGSKLDTFVTSHLDSSDVSKIAEALEESLKGHGESVDFIRIFQDQLKDTCAQDLCEQGNHHLPFVYYCNPMFCI